jgi:hypothetical protein
MTAAFRSFELVWAKWRAGRNSISSRKAFGHARDRFAAKGAAARVPSELNTTFIAVIKVEGIILKFDLISLLPAGERH